MTLKATIKEESYTYIDHGDSDESSPKTIEDAIADIAELLRQGYEHYFFVGVKLEDGHPPTASIETRGRHDDDDPRVFESMKLGYDRWFRLYCDKVEGKNE